jgi:hypothetical protein
MNNRVHVLTNNAAAANGKNTQFTTTNLVPIYGGSTKLDVWPAGGGMAGVMELEAMTLTRDSIHGRGRDSRDSYKRERGEKDRAAPRCQTNKVGATN